MHTNEIITSDATSFRQVVKIALVQRSWTMNKLAKQIHKSRNATSRAVNQNEFPHVQTLIKKKLGL